jgi:hypothetical protein
VTNPSKPPDDPDIDRPDWYCDEVIPGRSRVEVLIETEEALAFRPDRPGFGRYSSLDNARRGALIRHPGKGGRRIARTDFSSWRVVQAVPALQPVRRTGRSSPTWPA